MPGPKTTKTRQRLALAMPEDAKPPKKDYMPVSPEILAICKLIGTMKITVHELQNLLKLLGNGMEQVAELAPAVKASEEVGKIRAELEARIKLHEDETNDLREKLRKRVEDVIRTKFYDEAKSAMKDAVRRKVSDKVGCLLTGRIPDELRVQGHGHKRQILEIQTNLHNTEMRRLNSSLESANDPLHPLHRPLIEPGSTDSPPATAVELPTPSGMFPHNLPKLLSLPLDDLRLLIEEYGVDLPKSQADAGSPTTPDSATTLVNNDFAVLSKEELINMFMAHIGAPFRVLPAISTASTPPVSKKKLTSPLVTKINTRPYFG